MNHTAPILAALAGVAVVGSALAGNAQGLPIPRVAIEGNRGYRAIVECESGAMQIFTPDGNVYHHSAANGSPFHRACLIFNQPTDTHEL